MSATLCPHPSRQYLKAKESTGSATSKGTSSTGKTTRRKSGKSRKQGSSGSGSGFSKTPRQQDAQQFPFPAADPEEEEPELLQVNPLAQGKRVPQMRTAKARDGGRTQSGGIKGVLMDDADDF